MGKRIIDDELRALIEPLLPPPEPRREKNPGRLPGSDRTALTSENVNDVTQLLPLLDAIPPIRGLCGHPLRRPRVA